MAKRLVTDFLLYRWRYILGYSMFAIGLAAVLIIAGLFIPGGLSKAEISSALVSDGLDPWKLFSLQPEQLLYLPYRLLQALTIALFGFTSFAIKLPSIILAFLSACGLIALLGIWFKRNVAIIASTLAVTSGHFLLTAQSGNAGITYVFWAVCVLLTASFLTRRSIISSVWIVTGFGLAGLSLYMPLNIYVILALILTTLLHPHARHMILRRAPKIALAIGSLVFIVITLPLIIGAIKQPQIIGQLLGLPMDWNNLSGNLKQLADQYTSFYSPTSGAVIAPVYSLGTVLLILLGLYRLFTTKYTTKSYIISFWLILLIPFVIINPSFISITFVPLIILLAQGVDHLIRSWYKLFPRNPYARIFGLLPLGVLVIGITMSNLDRYAYGYHYDSKVYREYNFDVSLIHKRLERLNKNTSLQLVVAPKDVALYQSVARHQNYVTEVTVSSDAQKAFASKQLVIVARTMKPASALPDDIFVAKSGEDADRFYLYKNGTN